MYTCSMEENEMGKHVTVEYRVTVIGEITQIRQERNFTELHLDDKVSMFCSHPGQFREWKYRSDHRHSKRWSDLLLHVGHE
jgi:hypothetical protein